MAEVGGRWRRAAEIGRDQAAAVGAEVQGIATAASGSSVTCYPVAPHARGQVRPAMGGRATKLAPRNQVMAPACDTRSSEAVGDATAAADATGAEAASAFHEEYRLGEEIGRGAFGRVYAVRRPGRGEESSVWVCRFDYPSQFGAGRGGQVLAIYLLGSAREFRVRVDGGGPGISPSVPAGLKSELHWHSVLLSLSPVRRCDP